MGKHIRSQAHTQDDSLVERKTLTLPNASTNSVANFMKSSPFEAHVELQIAILHELAREDKGNTQ